MMRFPWTLLCSVVASLCAIAFSTTAFAHTELTHQGLADDPLWRALLVMDEDGESAIHTPAFFLADGEARDPARELHAALAAFAEPVGGDPDQHAQCRFPARFRFLDQRLDLASSGIRPVDCPDYIAFSGSVASISVVFATGYLGNPASYYGHLLLKFNTEVGARITSMDDPAINFGANVPPNDNMVSYIVNGVLGGYEASFTDQQYHYHANNYGEQELRDLWEYELVLSRDERELLTAHTWELLEADYTYYFFNRNCAYRMGELLGLVVEEPLIADWRLWETPQAIAQRLRQARHRGNPLVGAVRYHPSRQSRLYQRYAALDAQERSQVHALVEDPQALNGKAMQRLSLASQYQVLDTLIDYYQFAIKAETAEADDPDNYREVLRRRYMLPPGGESAVFHGGNRPHNGRRPSYVSLSLAAQASAPDSVRLGIRPAYYDHLDAGDGHIPHSELSMGELHLGVSEGRAYVARLEAVKIESLMRNLTGLPSDRQHAWRLAVGAEQLQVGCHDCLAAKANGAYGLATSFGRHDLVLATLAGAGFLGRSMDTDGLYLSARAVFNWHVSSRWTVHAAAEERRGPGGVSQTRGRLAVRAAITTNTDVRLQARHVGADEIALSIGYYW